MLNTAELQQLQALGGDEAKQFALAYIAQLQQSLKFKQTKIEALSFEVARLKQWRFGKSSESMDAPTQQGQLFDTKTEALLVEEAKAEDRAETEQRAPTHKKKTAKRQAIFTPSRPRRLLRWADRLRAPRGCVAWAATKSALRSGNKSRCSVMRLPVERATDSF